MKKIKTLLLLLVLTHFLYAQNHSITNLNNECIFNEISNNSLTSNASVFQTGRTLGQQEHRNPSKSGTFTDSRDGQTYRWVGIGNQVWMAENLNYASRGSSCYENKTEYCRKYGRLYPYNTALDACPNGWRLPGWPDWNTLIRNEAVTGSVGYNLKSGNDWMNNKNGSDVVGFNALPSGWGNADLGFYDLRSQAYWWMLDSNEAIGVNADNKFEKMVYMGDAFLMSIRCIKK